MKRRNFIRTGALGALGTGISGCSIVGPRSIKVSPAGVPFSFGDNYSKPKGGSMPMSVLGKTGIKISHMGFGSHMSRAILPYERERERMMHDAYELGINVFDVYDAEGKIYQYEPTGRHLAPMINDVLISITMTTDKSRTVEEELEHDLRLFGRDHIDLVRSHPWALAEDWGKWETILRLKEQGKIRACGIAIHHLKDLRTMLDSGYPFDYVIFPYNFYHNIAWDGHFPDEGYDTIPGILREKGVGVISMKPFAGDFLVTPLKQVAATFDKDINFVQAALRYVINSGIEADCTYAGMFYPSHVYENVDAFFNPAMSDDERRLLKKVIGIARYKSQAWLPDHYKFLDEWAPDFPEDDLEKA